MAMDQLDMIDAMAPDTDDQDAREDFMAAVGSVQQTPEEAFTGGYAETQDALEERKKGTATPTGRKVTTHAARGLGDVILTLPRADKEELLALILEARRLLNVASSGEVVLRAMRAWAISGRD